MGTDLSQKLRTDARANRERVLAAARALFAERGLDVGMREVARRAGVGPATLYRRFPTRQDLVDEAFSAELDACSAIVERASSDPDPWHGFVGLVESLTVLGVHNRGFVDAFLAAGGGRDAFLEHRRRLLRILADLMRRAQGSGALRRDCSLDDLVLVLMAGRGLAHLAVDRREAAARRFAALALDGFRG